MLVLSGEHQILRANAAFCDWLGIGEADLVGRPFGTLVTAGAAPAEALRLFLGRRQEDDTWRGSIPFDATVGARWVPLVATRLRDPAIEPGGWIVCVQTETPDVERGITGGISDDRALVQRLDAVSLLAGAVAHEINNPLMGLMGFAQLLEDRVGREGAEFVASILEQSERIRAISSRLLTFSKRSVSGFFPVPPAELLVSVLSYARATFARDNIRFTSSIPQEPLPKIHCDPAMMEQALFNLLENARAALGLLPVMSNRRRVDFQLVFPERAGRTHAQFTVCDGGGGAPSETAGLLEPLASGREESGQSLLRLVIARRIVLRHGGRLWFEQWDGGTGAFLAEIPTERPQS